MINEREINELLNLKIEEIDDLELWDEELKIKSDLKEPTSISPDLKDLINHVPLGEAGIAYLNKSKIVQQAEKDLVKVLTTELGKDAYRNKFAQVHAEERKPLYKQQVEKQYAVTLRQTVNLFQQLKGGNPVSYHGISKIVSPFVDYLEEDRAIVQNLATYITDEEDYLFHHITRVCLLSINIAAFYGLSKKEVLEVGIAAMLADVGMTLIDPKIRKKRGRLNSNELFEVQKHPILGLYAIEKIQGIPPQVKFVAYQHHERMSGMGYPKKRKGGLIHVYSRIVAVADVFEALCSERTYRIPYNPAEALDKVIKMTEMGLLDNDVVTSFIQCVSKYPVGCLVKLSDNTIAKVVASNPDHINRPVVARFTHSNGRYLNADEIVESNLSKDHSVEIEKVLDIKIKQNELMLGF